MDHDQLITLLENDFDEKLFVSKVLATKNLMGPLNLVSNRLSELDAAICQHVSKHNAELLSQTVDLENFSNIVGNVESRIRNLSLDVNRIKEQLAKPYQFISCQVTLIRRLCLLCDTLRHTRRVSTTINKLLESSEDLVASSECINELEYAFESMDWQGITVLQKHNATLLNEKEKLSTKVWQLLTSSLDNGDLTRIGQALQVFDNLGSLATVIHTLVSDWQSEVEDAIKTAVDVDGIAKRAKNKVISSLTSNGPGRASINSAGGQTAVFRSLLWTGLDQMVTSLNRCLNRSRLLSETLHKKGPSSGCLRTSSNSTLASSLLSYSVDNYKKPENVDCCTAIFMVLNSEKNDFASVDSSSRCGSECFLGWAAARMGALIEPSLSRRSGQLKEVLESEYPRLLKLFLNLERKQRQDLPSPLRYLLEPFETAFLSRSLTRLFDRVNSAFVGVSGLFDAKSMLDITVAERIVQAVATELAHAAAVHEDLFYKVAKTTTKVIALFATKVEALIGTTAEASELVVEGGSYLAAATPAQVANIHLVNFTCAFANNLRLAVARHTAAAGRHEVVSGEAEGDCGDAAMSRAQAMVDQALTTHLSTVCLTSLEPLLRGIADHITQNLLPRMHKCDSTYVVDLQKFIAHVRTTHLVGFSTSPSATGTRLRLPTTSAMGTPTAQRLFTSGSMALRAGLQTTVLPRCLDALTTNMSLVRPCTSEAERSRLVTDSAEVEMTLLTLVSPCAGMTGDAQTRLKAMRQVISIPMAEILSTCTSAEAPPPGQNRGVIGYVGNRLPGSLVLQHVISRAPPEIPLPHQSASDSWTVERYTHWCLTTADEPARLDFISKALAVYAEQVDGRQQRHYPEYYPVICDLLEYYRGRRT